MKEKTHKHALLDRIHDVYLRLETENDPSLSIEEIEDLLDEVAELSALQKLIALSLNSTDLKNIETFNAFAKILFLYGFLPLLTLSTIGFALGFATDLIEFNQDEVGKFLMFLLLYGIMPYLLLRITPLLAYTLPSGIKKYGRTKNELTKIGKVFNEAKEMSVTKNLQDDLGEKTQNNFEESDMSSSESEN